MPTSYLADLFVLLWYHRSRLMEHDPLAFETGNLVAAIPQLAEDGRGVCSQHRRQRADASGGTVESSRRARLPYPAKPQALILFEDVISPDLAILEKLKATQDRRGGDVVGKQAGQDFIGGPLLQLGGHVFARNRRNTRSRARGL